ncbi:hypothetical protein WJX72_009255 [[Myrmecia] bisecta]|uniref:G domain-containing protein n=1 Tax=[Myrmecia] bisecta TaxID=41462 RepID=A0AAW1PPI8_9CHLO
MSLNNSFATLAAIRFSAEVQRGTAERVGEAVSGGATAVLLSDATSSGGANLYEAACVLREVLRGRAALLIVDRTDIVDAAEADGVVLSARGVPTVVARRMLQGGSSLVGRTVSSAADAKAAAVDGASLVILEGAPGCAVTADELRAARTQQSSNSIPVIVSVSEAALSADDAIALCQAELDGVAFDLDFLQRVASAFGIQNGSSPLQLTESLLEVLSAAHRGPSPAQAETDEEVKRASHLKHLLTPSKEDLLEAERTFLSDALAFLQQATPEMEEMSLLGDALKQLDELFLLVVVGEFNSGKSTVINALLGARYLAEGILPTTNEITVVKFSESGSEEVVQDSDGFYVRYLPADLLREINIVDTPGTNVILDRQQRLTEEYVPRADLVLFVLSADRPFTESEVKFLKYIRQWGKKVVFIVNKVDILSDDREVQEVSQFVADNAQRLLGVEAAKVLPVSSRSAIDAKLAVGGGRASGGLLNTMEDGVLGQDRQWQASRFEALEDFIYQYLVGGASASESVRLKLQTPLFVADALLEASGRQLANELEVAAEEAEAVKLVQSQLAGFRAEMAKDGAAQQAECRKLISAAVKRAQKLVDNTLQLSNAESLSAYLLGSKRDSAKLPVARGFQAEVVGTTAERLQTLVMDHQAWLQRNCSGQLGNYRAFAESRAAQLGSSLAELQGKAATDSAQESAQWRAMQSASLSSVDDEDATSPSVSSAEMVAAANGSSETALQVVMKFEPRAAAALLEEEIREAVIATVGAGAGAAALGVVGTAILPTTLEDLLALAVSGLAGYVAVLNLPLRRAEAKAKLEKVANNFAKDVQGRLQQEMAQALDGCCGEINSFILPLEALAVAAVERLQEAEARRAELVEELDQLKQRAANVE